MQNWYENTFVDITMLFELPYMQIWNVLSNRSYTDSNRSSRLKYASVHSWATEKTYRLWKPIDMKLDMCDAKIKKHQFSNLLVH